MFPTKKHKKRFAILSLAVIFALALSACSSILSEPPTFTPTVPTSTPVPPTATPPPSVAIVNGEYITVAEFQSELNRYKAAQTALGKAIVEDEAKKVVLDDLISLVLLAQGAREAGFTLTETDVQSRIDSLLAQIGGADQLKAWQSAHGYDDASFRQQMKRAAEAAWMRDKIITETPNSVEQVHIRQILTYNAGDAQTALAQLQSGTDFDELAAKYDPYTRGELGWVPPGYLLDPKADEAVFALPVGSYSGIIETDAGFHIFKVVERGNHVLTPDALLTVQEQTLKKWLADRRAQSSITLVP